MPGLNQAPQTPTEAAMMIAQRYQVGINYEDLLVLMLTPPYKFDAQSVNQFANDMRQHVMSAQNPQTALQNAQSAYQQYIQKGILLTMVFSDFGNVQSGASSSEVSQAASKVPALQNLVQGLTTKYQALADEVASMGSGNGGGNLNIPGAVINIPNASGQSMTIGQSNNIPLYIALAVGVLVAGGGIGYGLYLKGKQSKKKEE